MSILLNRDTPPFGASQQSRPYQIEERLNCLKEVLCQTADLTAVVAAVAVVVSIHDTLEKEREGQVVVVVAEVWNGWMDGFVLNIYCFKYNKVVFTYIYALSE